MIEWILYPFLSEIRSENLPASISLRTSVNDTTDNDNVQFSFFSTTLMRSLTLSVNGTLIMLNLVGFLLFLIYSHFQALVLLKMDLPTI